MSEADPPRRSDVGYGRPPAEYRYKKGVSGNPKGRPRRKPQSDGKDPVNFAAQKANQYFMEEAYRMVTLREGDQTIKLPAIQAVFRAMGVAAMKGNRHAQRMMAELVQQVENDDRELRAEHLKTMMEYKCTWEQAIEEAKARGLRVPDPIPHPDDIVIDFIKAKAWICGPMTKEDKADFDRLLEQRDCQQLLVSKTAAGHAEAKSRAKQGWLDDWKLAQRLYDKLNDNLPKRYRKDLQDRCWEPGATLPGSQTTNHWPGE